MTGSQSSSRATWTAGLALVLALLAQPAAARTYDAHGWLWANQPSSASYVPSSYYSYNTSGATNTVTRWAEGRYEVVFPGLARDDWDAQIVAYGSGPEWCGYDALNNNGSAVFGDDLHVHVVCIGTDFHAVDSRFVINIVGQGEGSSVLTGAGVRFGGLSQGPSGWDGWNASGGDFDLVTNGAGDYTITIDGQNAVGANIQVTTTTAPIFGEWCGVYYWYQSGSDTKVRVRCWDLFGDLTHSKFALRMSVPSTLNQGYVWFHDTSSASYTPISSYQWNGATGATNSNTGGRNAVGAHWVRYPNLGSRGTTMVTAYGSGDDRCKIAGWSGSTTATVSVRCFDGTTHTPVSTRFSSWYREEPTGFVWNPGIFVPVSTLPGR